MPDPESTLSRKRSQKEFEELLLKEVLMELEAGDADYWEQKAMELAGQPGYTPTAEQRAAFEERLDLEVKRIQKLEQQISQIPETSQDSHDPRIAQTEQCAQTKQSAQVEQDAQSVQDSKDAQIPQSISDRRSKRRPILRRFGSIAAVIVLFIFMTMYHTVDAFAAGVDRFIATMVPDEGAEELRIEEKEGAGLELNMEDYIGMYVPEWIPRGYLLDSVRSSVNHKKWIFTNKSKDILRFEISKGVYSVLMDDEDVTEEAIYLTDSQGRLILTEDTAYVVWEDGEYLYTISGKLNLRDELTKMAKECVKVEK